MKRVILEFSEHDEKELFDFLAIKKMVGSLFHEDPLVKLGVKVARILKNQNRKVKMVFLINTVGFLLGKGIRG